MAENRYPTICDLRDVMAKLVDDGLGDHPVQAVIVPASTMWTLSRCVQGNVTTVDEPTGRPPLMVEFTLDGVVDRIGVCLVSSDYWGTVNFDGIEHASSQ